MGKLIQGTSKHDFENAIAVRKASLCSMTAITVWGMRVGINSQLSLISVSLTDQKAFVAALEHSFGESDWRAQTQGVFELAADAVGSDQLA